ncbi:MAG: histidine kinase, partial [Marmoricola sp.]
MGDLGRIAVAARVFTLAVLIPVTVLRAPDAAAPPLLLVIALAAVMNVASLTNRFREDLLAVVEGALIAVIAVTGHGGGNAVLPYLVVPMLLGSLSDRLPGLMRVLLAEVLAAALAWWPVKGTPTVTTTRQLLIWLVVGLGVGAAGMFLHRRFGGDTDAASYRDAIGLIQQLDALSGKLTGGLDPVTLAEQLMAEAEVQLPVQQAAVFTRSPSGDVTPLRYSTFSAPTSFGGLDDFVENCWRSERPLLRELTAGVPLRTESRTVGVLVLDLSHNSDLRALTRLQESLSGPALQLHAALLFDNVRSHATSEERNRLAREVHDGVAQDIASLGYVVDGLTASSENKPQREKLVALRSEVTRVVAELRASVYDLRNEMRAGQGLGQGVSAFARQIGSRSDLTVHVRLDEGATRLRPDIEAELLRIAQEAMNNARKHSGGQNLWVNCTV